MNSFLDNDDQDDCSYPIGTVNKMMQQKNQNPIINNF